MTDAPHFPSTVVTFTGRWHVIREIDVAPLIARHAQVARLCDRLEACADRLPAWPAEYEIEQLCRELDDLIDREEESDGVFAAELFGSEARDPLTSGLLRQIDAWQVANLIHAQDVVNALRSGPFKDGTSPETLSYMLRCFFMARRQTLAFEELTILQLGQHRLAEGGRTTLVESLRRRSA